MTVVDRASLPRLVAGVMLLDVVVVPRQMPRPGDSCVALDPDHAAQLDAEAREAVPPGESDARRTNVHALAQCDPDVEATA